MRCLLGLTDSALDLSDLLCNARWISSGQVWEKKSNNVLSRCGLDWAFWHTISYDLPRVNLNMQLRFTDLHV